MDTIVTKQINPLILEEDITPTEGLKKHFGFNSFKGQQLEAIENLLAGNDGLFLAPTRTW